MAEPLTMSKRSSFETDVNISITPGSSGEKQGILWKEDHFAQHDGPGIRTSLYFKGCPLRCLWCNNPEGQTPEPSLVLARTSCNGCGQCLKVCTTEALNLLQNGDRTAIQIYKSKCNSCGACASSCSTGALQVLGRSYTVSDVLALLEKNRLAYKKSGGGLTCTGGEPTYQVDFLIDLLAECRRRNIHTAVETSGYVDRKVFQAVLQLVDWLFIDLKHLDNKKHQMLTGKSNVGILSNARLASSVLQSRNKTLVIRTVVVPGINDGQNISDLSDFLYSLPFVTMVELLPYHRYGVHKYDFIDRKYSLPKVEPPSAEVIDKYKKQLVEPRSARHLILFHRSGFYRGLFIHLPKEVAPLFS